MCPGSLADPVGKASVAAGDPAPQKSVPIRGRGWIILAALAVLAVYAVSLSLLPKDVFWMPDEGAKYMEMLSVHWPGEPRYVVPFPARRIDTRFEFLPHPEIFPRPSIFPGGRLYIAFQTSIIFPFVSSVPFWLFGVTGIYLMPLLSGWGTALISGALIFRLQRRWAAFAVLLVGLATPVWFYSMVFWEHTIACFLAMLAVYVVAVSPRWHVAPVLAVAVALITAVILRIEMLTVAISVFLGWGIASFAASAPPATPMRRTRARVRFPRWALYFLLGALTIGLLLLLSASLTMRHHKLLSLVPVRIEGGIAGLWNAPIAFVEILVHAAISEGPTISDTIAIVVAGAVLLCGIGAFLRSTRAEALLVLPSCGVLLAFSIFLVSTTEPYRSLHGLFPAAPFLIVWPYALRHAWRTRGYAPLALTHVALFSLVIGVVAISGAYVAHGRLEVGMEWGQRYLLVLYPLLAVLTLVSLRTYHLSERPRWLKRAFTTVVAALMVTGIALEVRGVAMLYDTRQKLSTWNQALREEGPVITDSWWLPTAVAVLFTEHEMFCLPNRKSIPRWLELAAASGMTRFTVVSFDPDSAARFEDSGAQRLAERVVDGLYLTVLAPAEHGAKAPTP